MDITVAAPTKDEAIREGLRLYTEAASAGGFRGAMHFAGDTTSRDRAATLFRDEAEESLRVVDACTDWLRTFWAGDHAAVHAVAAIPPSATTYGPASATTPMSRPEP